MKRYWITLLSLLGVFSSKLGYSQTIIWGPEYTRSSVFNEQQIIQAGSEHLYILQVYKDPRYYFKKKVLHYDGKLKQQASATPLEFWYDGELGRYQASHYHGNQWRFYYTVQQANKDQELLCWTSVNPQTLVLEAPQQLLLATNYNKQGASEYRLGKTEDDQVLLYGLLPQGRKELAQLSVHVLDAEGQLLYTAMLPTTQEASLLAIEDVQDAWLSAEGVAYFLCKFYHNKSRKEEKKIGMPYHYALLTIAPNDTTHSSDDLTVLSAQDSAQVVSARLYANEGQLYCVGSYKTPSSAGLFQRDLKKATKNTQVIVYPEALWRSENQSRKHKKIGLKNYKLNSWSPQADGSYLATAEQRYTKVYWDKSEGQQALHQLHDILLLKWDAEGELLWYHCIAKRQRGGGEGYTNMKETWYSFAAFEKDGQIHLFYNDLPENKHVAPDALKVGYYNQPQDLDCWHYQLDGETGELMQANPLADAAGWLVYPQQMRLLPNGQLLLAALQPAASVKEKPLLRWGHLSLKAAE